MQAFASQKGDFALATAANVLDVNPGGDHLNAAVAVAAAGSTVGFGG